MSSLPVLITNGHPMIGQNKSKKGVQTFQIPISPCANFLLCNRRSSPPSVGVASMPPSRRSFSSSSSLLLPSLLSFLLPLKSFLSVPRCRTIQATTASQWPPTFSLPNASSPPFLTASSPSTFHTTAHCHSSSQRRLHLHRKPILLPQSPSTIARHKPLLSFVPPIFSLPLNPPRTSLDPEACREFGLSEGKTRYQCLILNTDAMLNVRATWTWITSMNGSGCEQTRIILHNED